MNAYVNGLGMFAISKLGGIPKYDIYCIIFKSIMDQILLKL